MRTRRIVTVAIGVFVIAAVTTLLWPDRTKLDPPSIRIVKVENAGVDDDEGKEMWLVTVRICNTNNTPFANQSLFIKNSLYVEDVAHPIEVHVTNRWIAIRGGLGCHMGPGDLHTTAFVVPAGADACRGALKYTNYELYSGRLDVLARQLPGSLRSRLPASFWKWAGLPRSRPSSNWHEIKIEAPFPSPALQLQKGGG